MKRFKLPITLMLFILSCIFVFFLTKGAKPLPEKTPNELLIKNPIFPSKWESGEIIADNIVWEEVSTTNLTRSLPLLGNQIEAIRIWNNQGDNFPPRITEDIIQFDNSLQAEIYFWIHRPEVTYYNKRPNFAGYCDPEKCYSSAPVSRSIYASRSIGVCAMGNKQNCQMWYYWARYGQYLVSVIFFAPNQGLDEYNFSSITQEAEKEFLQPLLKPAINLK